ncbi:hypothetical protein F0680_19460 [Salmonella enterica]|uniref:hypothetical protein n=1 Tax=Escherichia TaxID=561 RepID=UPI0012D09158|nr:hypothetical protein [Escherichia coli]ECR0053880.1 hypothetical protein [Salmonella enterica]EEX2010647.1 hypothetical protein [Escherichia coli]EIJ8229257.1 hypothetical protein [Salmonella enterica]MCH6915069.1 hypothetical protein [Escherichia coli]MCU6833612.1 hypothetical protein [Escherichia coli]
MNTVKTMNTAPTFFASPVAANEDYSDVRMTLREISEFIGVRFDNIERSLHRLVNQGVVKLPPMEEVKNHRNQTVKDYVFSGKQGRLDSIVLIAQNVPEMTRKLVERWDYLENELLKKEEENKSPFPDASKMTKLDWMREAVKLEEEKEQLVDLHIRKAIDAHSLTRLLGEKRGSTKVQMILKGLCTAGVLERRLDASGKPNGYDLLPPGYMFARMSAHGQIEFTADAIPHLVKLGLLEEEKAATLKLPQPNNSRAIVNNTALLIRQNAGSLEHFGL